ncbi:unnamed protein product [Prunus armeniaca]
MVYLQGILELHKENERPKLEPVLSDPFQRRYIVVENEVIPKVMDRLLKLPQHPQVLQTAEDSLHLVELYLLHLLTLRDQSSTMLKVITELPPDHAKRALEALCLPVVTPLQEVVSQGPDTLNSKPTVI